MKGIWIMISLALVSTPARGSCPTSQQLPPKYDSHRFLCARVYTYSSCGGYSRDIYNGEHDSNIGSSWNDDVSSLVVRKECTLTVYQNSNYGGQSRIFGLNLWDRIFGDGICEKLKDVSLGGWGSRSWNDRITGWKCNCDFTNVPLTCTPKEREFTMRSCTNVNPGSMTCEHSATEGMEIGYSVTYGNSISNSVGLSLRATFMQVFSMGLSASTTTTYDWSTTTSKTFSYTKTFKFTCEVPIGATVHMKQVIGTCGDTVVYTKQHSCV